MKQFFLLLKCNKNYRAFWLAFLLNQIGDWFNLILFATLIYKVTASGIAISYLFLARFIPQFIFSPLGGVLADKYSRKKILVIVNMLQAITLLFFLLFIKLDSFWIICFLSTILFCLYALYEPASMAIIPSIVKKEDIITASTLQSLTWSTMLMVGAFLGGLVASFFGTELTLIINVIAFLLASYFLGKINCFIHESSDTQGKYWTKFLSGIHYLKQNLSILSVVLLKGMGTFCWAAIPVLEVIYSRDIYLLGQDGTISLGLFYAVAGIGTGFGPLIIRKILGETIEKILVSINLGFALLVSGICISAFANNIFIFSLGILFRTFGAGTLWVFSTVLLQLLIPNKFRGRVFSLEFTIATLTQALSIYFIGLISIGKIDYVKLKIIMLGLSIIGAISWIAWNLLRNKWTFIFSKTDNSSYIGSNEN